LLAPKLIGGDGRAGLGALGLSRLAQAVSLRRVETGRLGDDLRVTGRLGDFV
jgi:riboflavin biosynthesis pyrimidine reductase